MFGVGEARSGVKKKLFDILVADPGLDKRFSPFTLAIRRGAKTPQEWMRSRLIRVRKT